MDLELRTLRSDDEAPVRRLHEQLAEEGVEFLFEDGTWEEILGAVDRDTRHPVGAADGRIRADFLVAEVGGEIVGRVSIRHGLSPRLREMGGHVGYVVGPAFRGRGHASAMLRLSLRRLAALGVREVLLTCDDTNAASIAVIERCGGVLEDTRETLEHGRRRRYWIDAVPD